MIIETERGKSGELNIPFLFQRVISQRTEIFLQNITPTQTLFLRGILTFIQHN